MTEPTIKAELPKLAISCTSTNCGDNLHCFRSTKKLRVKGLGGACRDCHAELVDWPRVHERDLTDVEHTFSELRLELIRHFFWHVPIDQGAQDHALRKGRVVLLESAERRIGKVISVESPYRDGQQTPFQGNAIYYAQHATASCCRTCVEYWHGIEKGRAMTAEEQAYLVSLVTLYINDRLPDLPDRPTKVPRGRREQPGEA
jgi:Domain of unknown function (DUF4186)